jgi:hypothetical protein
MHRTGPSIKLPNEPEIALLKTDTSRFPYIVLRSPNYDTISAKPDGEFPSISELMINVSPGFAAGIPLPVRDEMHSDIK